MTSNAVSVIDGQSFIRSLSASSSGSFILYGSEDYLKDRCLESARKALALDESFSMFNEITLDANDASADTLKVSLDSLPLMAEIKLVILKGFRPGALKADQLEAFMNVFASTATLPHNLFFVCCPAEVAVEVRKDKPVEWFAEATQWLKPVSFEKPSTEQLLSWVRRHFQSNGIQASPALCRQLVDRSGTDMYALSLEIDKISWYLLSRGSSELTSANIREIAIQDHSFGAFDLSNALLASRKDDALRIVRNMKFNRVEPIPILGQIFSLFCDQLNIRVLMDEGKSKAEIADILGINAYRVGLLMQSLINVSAERIRTLLRQCQMADTMAKRGGTDFEPIDYLLCAP
ncbi:MAG: DNA polymerase III subunit delta [Clostridia bacterium]|nr:DNA polymerase III subunit delta [Clostridia bacterium]